MLKLVDSHLLYFIALVCLNTYKMTSTRMFNIDVFVDMLFHCFSYWISIGIQLTQR